MATRASLRAALRRALGDTVSGSYVWSDELLNDFLARAMADLSVDLPIERRVTVSLLPGQTEYPLPSDFLAALAVVADGEPLPPAPGGESGWWWAQGKLLIQPAPRFSRDVELHYLAERQLPSDDVSEATLEATEEPVLLVRAKTEAYRWWEEQAARRGVSVPERAAAAMAEYQQMLRSRRGVVAARRLGGWL